MWEDILVRVAGGVVYTFLALATKEWLVPKIRELTYQGVVISGTWEAYFNGIEEPAAVIDFTQHGRNISGVSQVTRNSQGERVDRRYRYSGRFPDRSLVFTFEDLKNPNMFGGSMAFHTVNSDGTCMNGAAMFYKSEATTSWSSGPSRGERTPGRSASEWARTSGSTDTAATRQGFPLPPDRKLLPRLGWYLRRGSAFRVVASFR